MTSKLFKKIANIAFFSLSLLVLNKILPTIIHLKFSQQEINNPKVIEYMNTQDYYPHAWLEYSRNNNWIPYETTTNDFTDSIKIYPRLIDTLISDNTVLLPKEEYHPTSYHQIIQNGNLKRSINLEEIIKEKGLIYGLSKSFKLN